VIPKSSNMRCPDMSATCLSNTAHCNKECILYPWP